MRLLWFVLASLTLVVNAQFELAAQLPRCALTCILDGLPDTNCSLTDVGCMCADDDLWVDAYDCVLTSCSILDALSAQKTAAEACNTPTRSRGLLVAILGPVLTGVALLFVILRVIARHATQIGMFGVDDALIVAAWIVGAPLAVFDGYLYRYGLGQDIWMVSPENITRLLRLFYIGEVMYLISTVLTKLALLVFLLRVFPHRVFRLATWGVICACVAFAIGFLFPLVFQCRPISYAWLRWDGEHEGQCINIYAGIFAHAAINMVLDLVILVLPMPMLFKLHITYSWRQKSHIFIMFSFGLIVTIVCILRLDALVPLRSSLNITWDYWGSVLWSVIEQEVGIICACLPAAKVVLARLLPGWLGLRTNVTASGRRTPGTYISASGKQSSSRPSERDSVVVQNANDGFTELVEIQTRDEYQRSKRLSTVHEAQRALSDAEASLQTLPVSTKQWS